MTDTMFSQNIDLSSRDTLYMRHFLHIQIPNKLIRLVKATMHDTVAKIQVQIEMTELF